MEKGVLHQANHETKTTPAEVHWFRDSVWRLITTPATAPVQKQFMLQQIGLCMTNTSSDPTNYGNLADPPRPGGY